MVTRIATVIFLSGVTIIASPGSPILADMRAQSAEVKSPLSSGSEKFLKDVLDDSFWEVEMAKVAQANSNDERVQRYGECLQADHEKAIQELRTLMTSKGLEPRAKIPAGQMRIVDERKEVVGTSFDKAYLSEMVRAHESAIADFKKHQDDSDADVKRFVAKALPVLQEHLDKAVALKKEIEK